VAVIFFCPPNSRFCPHAAPTSLHQIKCCETVVLFYDRKCSFTYLFSHWLCINAAYVMLVLQHNLCFDNCHSHVAYALNLMKYDGSRSWNMVTLCFLMLIHGKYVGFVCNCLYVALLTLTL